MSDKENPSDKITIVVGYDQVESIAYHVFCQSVLEKASIPVSFVPLTRNSIRNYCEDHTDGSNQFTYTRFLTPYLLNYQGWAIYADSDMVCMEDIAELWKLRDSTKAIQVVKHDYKTKFNSKYLSKKNENYPRKNWSSLILWNCEHIANRIITPLFVENKSGAYLHQFKWIHDSYIGELPPEWNWLAIEYQPNYSASLIHYTLGLPCFDEYRESEMSDVWNAVYKRTIKGGDD